MYCLTHSVSWYHHSWVSVSLHTATLSLHNILSHCTTYAVSPILSENSVKCHCQETEGPLQCVYGQLPADLDGLFIRNGPNPYLNSFEQPYHAFNGSGMVHVIDLKDGTASYRNKWVKTQRFDKEKAQGKPLTGRQSMDEQGIQLGAANTSTVFHANKLMALLEADRCVAAQWRLYLMGSMQAVRVGPPGPIRNNRPRDICW